MHPCLLTGRSEPAHPLETLSRPSCSSPIAPVHQAWPSRGDNYDGQSSDDECELIGPATRDALTGCTVRMTQSARFLLFPRRLMIAEGEIKAKTALVPISLYGFVSRVSEHVTIRLVEGYADARASEPRLFCLLAATRIRPAQCQVQGERSHVASC